MIVMTPQATEEQIRAVTERLETTGVHVVVMPGELTTAIGAIDIASFWMVGPPFRDSAAATPPHMIPSEFAGLTTASTGMVVMSLLAR